MSDSGSIRELTEAECVSISGGNVVITFVGCIASGLGLRLPAGGGGLEDVPNLLGGNLDLLDAVKIGATFPIP